MFHTSSFLRTAAGIAGAILLAQSLAGCSGATQALPGSALTQSSQPQHKGSMSPFNCNGCNNCPPGYQYGTWWEEYTDTNPPTWAEFTGDYVIQVVNGVPEHLTCGTWTEDQVCSPKSYANCPPQNPWWSQMAVADITGVEDSYAVSVPTSNEVVVVQSLSAKKGWNVISTLTTGSSTPVGVAADHYGTIYASVFSGGGSNVQPSVDVYAQGSTSPSSVLTDPAANGDSPAGIAVDKRRDIFWAFDTTIGSSATIQIDKFPEGQNNPVPFATIPGFGGGAVAVTKSGDVVASAPSEGMIYIFAPTAKLLGKFAASGSPSSISLDAKNQNLYVADGTNNAISTYAFPSGELISSGPLETKKGVVLVPTSVLPKDPQLP